MKTQRFLVFLTVVNLLLFIFTLAQMRPVSAQGTPGVLRGHALEIVDDNGNVRADIKINPASTMAPCAVSQNPACGRTFPEAVVLHMSDPDGLIRVKIDADQDGSGMMLANSTQQPGIAISAKAAGTSLSLTNSDGRVQVLKP
jgi:hypothetical protein